jgi:hypothetical protein
MIFQYPGARVGIAVSADEGDGLLLGELDSKRVGSFDITEGGGTKRLCEGNGVDVGLFAGCPEGLIVGLFVGDSDR